MSDRRIGALIAMFLFFQSSLVYADSEFRSLNTEGIRLYRARDYDKALEVLKRALKAAQPQSMDELSVYENIALVYDALNLSSNDVWQSKRNLWLLRNKLRGQPIPVEYDGNTPAEAQKKVQSSPRSGEKQATSSNAFLEKPNDLLRRAAEQERRQNALSEQFDRRLAPYLAEDERQKALFLAQQKKETSDFEKQQGRLAAWKTENQRQKTLLLEKDRQDTETTLRLAKEPEARRVAEVTVVMIKLSLRDFSDVINYKITSLQMKKIPPEGIKVSCKVITESRDGEDIKSTPMTFVVFYDKTPSGEYKPTSERQYLDEVNPPPPF